MNVQERSQTVTNTWKIKIYLFYRFQPVDSVILNKINYAYLKYLASKI